MSVKVSALMPQSARVLLAERLATVQATGKSFVSPCVSVCRMDAGSGLCLGCLRTLEEIAGWAQSDALGQLAVWKKIGQRLKE